MESQRIWFPKISLSVTKWFRCLPLEPLSLWHRVIRSRYILHQIGWETRGSKHESVKPFDILILGIFFSSSFASFGGWEIVFVFFILGRILGCKSVFFFLLYFLAFLSSWCAKIIIFLLLSPSKVFMSLEY